MDISTLSSKLTNPAALFSSARRAADPAAKSFNSALSEADGAQKAHSPASDAAIQLNELRTAAELSLSEFKRTLKQVFTASGIDTSVPIRLEPDGKGGVLVGEHPDRDKIERIFEDNPDLAAKFQALDRRYVDLRAAGAGLSPAESLVVPTFGLNIVGDDIQVAFS